MLACGALHRLSAQGSHLPTGSLCFVLTGAACVVEQGQPARACGMHAGTSWVQRNDMLVKPSEAKLLSSLPSAPDVNVLVVLPADLDSAVGVTDQQPPTATELAQLCPALRNVDTLWLQALLEQAGVQRFEAGTMLLAAGEAAQCAFILLSGCCVAECSARAFCHGVASATSGNSDAAAAAVTVHEAWPGAALGLGSAATHTPLWASMRAVNDVTVLEIPAGAVAAKAQQAAAQHHHTLRHAAIEAEAALRCGAVAAFAAAEQQGQLAEGALAPAVVGLLRRVASGGASPAAAAEALPFPPVCGAAWSQAGVGKGETHRGAAGKLEEACVAAIDAAVRSALLTGCATAVRPIAHAPQASTAAVGPAAVSTSGHKAPRAAASRPAQGAIAPDLLRGAEAACASASRARTGVLQAYNAAAVTLDDAGALRVSVPCINASISGCNGASASTSDGLTHTTAGRGANARAEHDPAGSPLLRRQDGEARIAVPRAREDGKVALPDTEAIERYLHDPLSLASRLVALEATPAVRAHAVSSGAYADYFWRLEAYERWLQGGGEEGDTAARGAAQSVWESLRRVTKVCLLCRSMTAAVFKHAIDAFVWQTTACP
jgi:Cyclic nucleotide-binding domain